MAIGVAINKKQFAGLAWAAPPLLISAVLYTLQHTSSGINWDVAPDIHAFRRRQESRCPVHLTGPDACHLIQDECPNFDDDRLIPYMRLYACTPSQFQPAVLVGMLLWLAVLFASMATAASDFLAVHLQYIVRTVGMSESLAGVTIFAFGNGCTDLFSTFAAMEADSGSLAINELFGAAAFITTVVLGLIALLHPFTVDPRAFVEDVVWFILAASLLVAFLADGQLALGECFGIIGLYVAFIFYAVLRPRGVPKPTLSAAAPASYTDETVDGDGADDSPVLDANQSTSSSSSETLEADQSAERQSVVVAESGSTSVPDTLEESDSSTTTTVRQNSRAMPTLRSFPPLYERNSKNSGERVLSIIALPLLFPIGLTTPPCLSEEPNVEAAEPRIPVILNDIHSLIQVLLARINTCSPGLWLNEQLLSIVESFNQHWLLCVQLILGPQLFTFALVSQTTAKLGAVPLISGSLIALCASFIFIAYAFLFKRHPGAGISISILAFVTSLTWIFLTATSAVSLLITLAEIFNIPASLLGATVFAVGQSSNDLFANTAIAKRGMPVLAASASFGGPMMNMLIGIGGGGLVQILKSGSASVYTFQAEAGMFVSAACLLVGLFITLGWAFVGNWRLGKGLGTCLILLWSGSAIFNVVLSTAA